MMIPNYVIRSEVSRLQAARNQDAAEIDQKVIQYNDKFAHLPRPLGRHLQEDAYLLQMAYSSRPIYRWAIIFLVTLAVLYLILPVDFIPDSLGAIGFLDDFVIFFFVTILLYELAQRYRNYLLADINRRNA